MFLNVFCSNSLKFFLIEEIVICGLPDLSAIKLFLSFSFTLMKALVYLKVILCISANEE